MANPLVGYLASVAGRTVAGVGSAVYSALTDSKEAQAPESNFDDDVRSRKPLKPSRGRKASSSAEKPD